MVKSQLLDAIIHQPIRMAKELEKNSKLDESMKNRKRFYSSIHSLCWSKLRGYAQEAKARIEENGQMKWFDQNGSAMEAIDQLFRSRWFASRSQIILFLRTFVSHWVWVCVYFTNRSFQFTANGLRVPFHVRDERGKNYQIEFDSRNLLKVLINISSRHLICAHLPNAKNHS